MATVVGDSLVPVERVDIVAGSAGETIRAAWLLRGVTSNERYVTRAEKQSLLATQQGLGRADSTLAALVPIRKNSAWWALSQDERRRVFEDSSHHVATGLRYLPAIARRLHHCRDLSEAEPFDFLTLFEYAPIDADAFENLVGELRATEEWQYVDREIDIRLERR
jgi:chlorite dismutase